MNTTNTKHTDDDGELDLELSDDEVPEIEVEEDSDDQDDPDDDGSDTDGIEVRTEALTMAVESWNENDTGSDADANTTALVHRAQKFEDFLLGRSRSDEEDEDA